ncbi:MAG: hypothetical protein Q9163_000486 [Psora crenata]
MVIESPAFQKAVEDVRKLKTEPTQGDKLEIYGLYKVGTGSDLANAKQPWKSDIRGNFKMNAWKEAAEGGKLSPQDAQKKYVEKVEHMKGVYGYEG